MHLAYFGMLAALSLGWADITVQPSRSGSINTPWQRSLVNLDRPSDRTRETLKRYSVEANYRRNPDIALARLKERILRDGAEPEIVYALAELSWIEGKREDRWGRAEALGRFVDAVGYSYEYLFDPGLAAGRSPADPRFRLAMDLYNGSLDHILRAAQEKGRIEPGGVIKLEVHGRELNLRVNLEQSPWKTQDIHELLFCSDFEVHNLPTRTYQYGLGVPLIGVRKTDHSAQS